MCALVVVESVKLIKFRARERGTFIIPEPRGMLVPRACVCTDINTGQGGKEAIYGSRGPHACTECLPPPPPAWIMRRPRMPCGVCALFVGPSLGFFDGWKKFLFRFRSERRQVYLGGNCAVSRVYTCRGVFRRMTGRWI